MLVIPREVAERSVDETGLELPDHAVAETPATRRL